MNRIGVTALIAVTLVTAVRPASAQPYQPSETSARSGGWFGAGVGLGSSSLSCRICASDRRVGTALLLRGGLTLSPRVRLGAELAGWARFDEVSQFLGTVTPVAYFYPQPDRGLHLTVGPSLSFFTARDREDTEVGTTSFGVQLGTGYDVPIGGSTMLSPYLHLTATSFGTLTSEGREITGGAGVTLIHLGVAVTFN